MKWKLKTETIDKESGCRNAIKDRPDARFAGIYNSDGIGVANIDRLGRRDSNGNTFVHDHVADNEEPDLHITTDAEWHAITKCIGAAPEMLVTLEKVLQRLDCKDTPFMAIDIDIMKRDVRAVLAKAKPIMAKVKSVKRKVVVEVEVEIDVDTIDGRLPLSENAELAMLAATRQGKGRIVRQDVLTPDPAAHNVKVLIKHKCGLVGARWCDPIDFIPTNVIEGSHYSFHEKVWLPTNNGYPTFGLAVKGDYTLGQEVVVPLHALRVVKAGNCEDVGAVMIDYDA
jgi:hypothetical protein